MSQRMKAYRAATPVPGRKSNVSRKSYFDYGCNNNMAIPFPISTQGNCTQPTIIFETDKGLTVFDDAVKKRAIVSACEQDHVYIQSPLVGIVDVISKATFALNFEAYMSRVLGCITLYSNHLFEL